MHFQRAAPEKLPYAINRYRREAERHYAVLDKHLEGRSFIVGSSYTIADISAWGWIDRANFVLAGSDEKNSLNCEGYNPLSIKLPGRGLFKIEHSY